MGVTGVISYNLDARR